MESQEEFDQPKKSQRREFLKTVALGAGALTVLGGFRFKQNDAPIADAENKQTDKLQLKIAGYDYNRIKALINGKVKIENCQFTFEKRGIGDMNTEAFAGPQSYDVTEIGLHPYMLAYANDGFRDYTLLPIFPLRVFRHKSVFIRTDRGINKVEDLKGKTIGTPGYSSSSLTWIRGIFKDEYGLDPKDINWVTSAADSSAMTVGKVSKNELMVPKGINMITGPAGKDESELLESGEIDALFHAIEPKAYLRGDPNIARLFNDYRSVEQAYFSKTGIFPIMHAVAVKKTLLEEHPWLAKNLFEAYSKSKQMDFKFMQKLGWAYDSLPWYGKELEDTRKLMGENFYPYGIESNQNVLNTFFGYSYNQGLASKKLTIEELFYPGSLGFTD